MHLETVTEFKRMQSTKKIGYTYFRFEKNAHKELSGCPVAAVNANGTYILIPFAKSSKKRLISDEMINERLNKVVQSIQSDIDVKIMKSEQIPDITQNDAPWERFELPRCGAPAAFKAAALPG